MGYYFNNNFDKIFKLRNRMFYMSKVDEDDLMQLEGLIREYGIKEKPSKLLSRSDEATRQSAINEWLKFEYPDVIYFEDLKECRYESNLLKGMHRELRSKPINQNVPKYEAKKVIDDVVVYEDISIAKKITIIGIPVSLITLIVTIANTVN